MSAYNLALYVPNEFSDSYLAQIPQKPYQTLLWILHQLIQILSSYKFQMSHITYIKYNQAKE